MMFWKLSLVVAVTLLSKGCDCQPFVCGKAILNSKIVGGENASAGAWPWQASLHQDNFHFCGGSVINSKWVLSAAHCFPGTPNASDFTVYLGRQSQDLPNPNEVSRSVSKIIPHPFYNPSTNDNDMALLELSSPVTFTNFIQPVCLAAEGSTFNSDMMWVTGWGNINSGVPLPSPQILQEVSVPMVGNSVCNCLYSGTITDNMMCAGPLEGGKDSCQGDSGGPMVIKQGSSWIQAGVVSFGKGCADPNLPGVYARVSQYQSWISQTVGMGKAGFVNFTSTTPEDNRNVTCPTPPTVCGGSASLYPWMVSITYNNFPVCVGTLVNDQFVLTSASCFHGYMDTHGWAVTLHVANWWDCSIGSDSIDVDHIFFDSVFGNGVALVRLSYSFFGSANLPFDMFHSNFPSGTECLVVGWNSAEPSFQEFQATIADCDPSDTTEVNICTESLDVQQDDDGSPLLCKEGYMWVQVGILSVHPGSGMNPQNSTVFTRTAPFSYFLTNTINNDVPTIVSGAESFSALSLACILMLSLAAVLQSFY